MMLGYARVSTGEQELQLQLNALDAGLVAAKKVGLIGGRKPSMTPAKLDAARTLLQSGMPPKDVAANIGVSIPTLYRHIPASGKTTDDTSRTEQEKQSA